MVYLGREATPVLDNGDSIQVGLWGWCASSQGTVSCSQPKPGFKIDSGDLPFNDVDVGILGQGIGSALGYLALTNAIAGVFALCMTIMGCIGHFHSQRNGRILIKTAKFAIIVIIMTVLAFVFDVILFEIGRQAINKTRGIHASLSNAFWMMVAALSFEAASMLTFFVGHRFIVVRMKKAEEIKQNPEMSGEAYLEQKQLEDDGASTTIPSKRYNNNQSQTHQYIPPPQQLETQPLLRHDTTAGRPLPIPPTSNPPLSAGSLSLTQNEKHSTAFPPHPPVPPIPPQYYPTSGSTSPYTSPYTSPPFGPTQAHHYPMPMPMPINSTTQLIQNYPTQQEHSYYNSNIYTGPQPSQPQAQPPYYQSQQGQRFDSHSRAMSEMTPQRQQSSDHEKGHTTGCLPLEEALTTVPPKPTPPVQQTPWYARNFFGKRKTATADARHADDIVSPNASVPSDALGIHEDPETKRNNSLPFDDSLIVFVLGGPGSGKGTQCEQLEQMYGLVHISTGDLLRQEVANNTEIGQEIKNAMEEGKMVSNDVTTKLLLQAMKAASQDATGFLIDGFPRTMDQAIEFENNIGSCTFVLYYECPTQVLINRLVKRGETSGRMDDNLTSIEKRIQVFEKTSLPVIEYYLEDGRVQKVNGDAPIEEVTAQTCSIFDWVFTGGTTDACVEESTKNIE
ncbi:10655_t:CDS:10, partial [Ambispora leptoticha]